MWTVKDVCELAGITPRTLRHWEEVGLLSPERTDADQRIYDENDLDRVQQILLHREMGFRLAQILELLDEGVDRTTALASQVEVIEQRMEQMRQMKQAVERQISAARSGVALTEEERHEVFDSFDPDDFADESEQRWGDTDAWRQSRERSEKRSKEDWVDLRHVNEQFLLALATAKRSGVQPVDVEAMDLAERGRRLIDENFYDCPPQMHEQLGQMYVDDVRFTAYYDEAEPGLAVWYRDAITANAARHQQD